MAAAPPAQCTMAKPGTDRDGAMVAKKNKDKISPFTKTLKLDRSKLLGVKEGTPPKSSMKRKLSFTMSTPRNEERHSDTDESVPDQSTESWVESEGRLVTPCRMYSAGNCHCSFGLGPLDVLCVYVGVLSPRSDFSSMYATLSAVL
eukprot:XP_014043444.1 PREDICTED: ankyrin repeat domain-containing protein 12-like isoform X2 [Salmo salar]